MPVQPTPCAVLRRCWLPIQAEEGDEWRAGLPSGLPELTVSGAAAHAALRREPLSEPALRHSAAGLPRAPPVEVLPQRLCDHAGTRASPFRMAGTARNLHVQLIEVLAAGTGWPHASSLGGWRLLTCAHQDANPRVALHSQPLRPPMSCPALPPAPQVVNPSYDYVPPELISLFVTGALTAVPQCTQLAACTCPWVPCSRRRSAPVRRLPQEGAHARGLPRCPHLCAIGAALRAAVGLLGRREGWI